MNKIDKLGLLLDTCGSRRRLRSVFNGPAGSTRPGIGWIDVGAAVIRYRIQGAGAQTIVLAADPPIVVEHYDQLIRLLESDFRVIVLEMPGFGFSVARIDWRFGFSETNDLIASAIRQIAGGPCILAFPCVSAYCGIDIANRYPDLVCGLVVIQAPSWSEQVRWRDARDPVGMLKKPVIGQLMLKILKKRIPAMWLGAAIGHRDRLSGLVETADDAFANGACFCLASVFQHYLTNEAPTFKTVSCPGLIVWGKADRSHRCTDKHSTLGLLPDAAMIFFNEAGHFPELEEPERFAQVVKEWSDEYISGSQRHCHE